jgi:hypothetical protein
MKGQDQGGVIRAGMHHGRLESKGPDLHLPNPLLSILSLDDLRSTSDAPSA